MANRRMLAKQISVSEQTNKLTDTQCLIYTWMIPHADDWGIIPGAAATIKALVVPMRDICTAAVEDALQKMVELGLIYRYEVDGRQWIQFPSWETYQTGLQRRTASKVIGYQKFVEIQTSSEKVSEIKISSKKIREIQCQQNLSKQNNTTYPRNTEVNPDSTSPNNLLEEKKSQETKVTEKKEEKTNLMAELVIFFANEIASQRGIKLVINWGKDTAMMAKIVKALGSYEEVKNLLPYTLKTQWAQDKTTLSALLCSSNLNEAQMLAKQNASQQIKETNNGGTSNDIEAKLFAKKLAGMI